jgi:hypothetical protein
MFKNKKIECRDISQDELNSKSEALVDLCEKAIRDQLEGIHYNELNNKTHFIESIFSISTANSLNYLKDSQLFWKISIHIIIVNSTCFKQDNRVFSARVNKLFSDQIKKDFEVHGNCQIDDELPGFTKSDLFDIGVYNKSMKLRSVHCSK